MIKKEREIGGETGERRKQMKREIKIDIGSEKGGGGV